MSEASSLDQICEQLGIVPRYRDHAGAVREVPEATLRSLVQCLNVTRADRILPPVFVWRDGDGAVVVPIGSAGPALRWTLEGETQSLAGRVDDDTGRLVVAPALAVGYYKLTLYSDDSPIGACTLIAAPAQAYLPPLLKSGGRLWGLATQLFALRSMRNWGIGDFTDLAEFIHHAAAQGVAAIGLTPLHALFFDEPDRCSPYSPSSRSFLNVLYIDPEAMPEFARCEAARALRVEPEFDGELARLRSNPRVDYAGVAGCKRRMFDVLYRHFQEQHLKRGDEYADAFDRFRHDRGKRLRQFATFEALREQFAAKGASLSWPSWPEPFRDPDSQAVADFVARHSDRVIFFEYLQWHAHRQLLECQDTARAVGMPIGVYLDIAVGVDRDSAEAWWSQDYLVGGWSIGAPPDNWNLKGQSWGAPPPNATRMRETAYAAIRECLDANMRAAGAIRIDHILGFMRMFWVPEAANAAEGAYIRYPLPELLSILALESQRHRCLVIGEDLGTVPDGLHEAMQAAAILCYRLLYFEHEADGSFRKPENWPQQALVAPSTHDLSTLPAWWRGSDLELRSRLDLYPSAEVAESEQQRRGVDRQRLTDALAAQGLPASAEGDAPIEAIYRFLARTPSHLLMVQPEDLLGEVEPQNVPGTTSEHPNWRRKLPVSAQEFFAGAAIARVVEAINIEGRRAPQRKSADAIPNVPTATYRLQFNRHFTFADAARLVPYLRELGISHVYASSYLKARPGSAHGYDIIDHNALNPEIGSAADFERYCDALRDAGMGQILDFIPNHMGIGHADNRFWLDVLEWGATSPFAPFFDINWNPRQPNLKGKVLVPMLGDHYGHVLERGELQLTFDPESGSFSVWYFGHRFPIHPRCYHAILGDIDADLKRLAVTVAEVNEAAMRSVGEKLKDDLASFVRADPAGLRQIEDAARRYHGQSGDPGSFKALHDLLEQQAYRLAFWRVAADEINYRRFFDINELAGVRMENPEVFAHIHQLVGQLIADGKLHGLRLDHIDGLLDPAGYLTQLRDFASARSASCYITVEKILARHERLRPDWPVDGTTGYDFINLVNGLYVDPDGKQAMDRTYRRFLDRSADFDEILYACKLLVMDTMLSSELHRLSAALDAISEQHWSTRDYTEERLRAALREVIACFPVYRTYVTDRGPSADDRRDIDWAVGQARRSYAGPDPEILDFVKAALTLDLAERSPPFDRDEIRRFALRFQQYTGPVTAKAMEDTCFYRYNRLLSLNEVGGDPRQFGVTVSAFHHLMQDRAKTWPNAMSALSTHDTKRGADMRARLNVLSEMAPVWNQRVRRWASLNRYKRGKVNGGPAPSPNDEYAIYQTLLGAWPARPDEMDAFCERVKGTVLKSIREAKRRTSWHNPSEAYESACLRFVERLLEADRPNPFLDDFIGFQQRLAQIGVLNSLSQLVVSLTAPGAPDTYQGCELWDFNMVDPDNRRPVDFALHRRMLAEIREADRRDLLRDSLANWQDGKVKLAIASALLRCRREHTDLFRQGSYEPIAVEGPLSHRLIAFRRAHGTESCIVIAGRLLAPLLGDRTSYDGAAIWRDTRLTLPEGPAALTNVLTGATVPGPALELGGILADAPVAVLLA